MTRSRSLETRPPAPRQSYGAQEQPSPSKRRRLETRDYLPSSDELCSSGMGFYLLFTMQAAHRFTQTMFNQKKFRGRMTQRRLKAPCPLPPSICHLSALMSQGVVGGYLSILLNDLTCPIQTKAQPRLMWNGNIGVNSSQYARTLTQCLRRFQPSQSLIRESTFPVQVRCTAVSPHTTRSTRHSSTHLNF